MAINVLKAELREREKSNNLTHIPKTGNSKVISLTEPEKKMYTMNLREYKLSVKSTLHAMVMSSVEFTRAQKN